jgi:hypothetical protein
VVANTILRRLTGEWGGRRRHAIESRARIERPARELQFRDRAATPSVRIEARELEDLAVGKVIRLNLPPTPARSCAPEASCSFMLSRCGWDRIAARG